MARAQFEYDEVGNTFYYVIVSFFAVVLFPLTYFLWPSLRKFFCPVISSNKLIVFSKKGSQRAYRLQV